MDQLTHWRNLIKQTIESTPHYRYRMQGCDMETVCIFDETRDHYLLMRVGWEAHRHVEYITLHIRIKNDKIWIETDWTEEGIANELAQAGVSHENIVLGFQPPGMRLLTDFAAA